MRTENCLKQALQLEALLMVAMMAVAGWAQTGPRAGDQRQMALSFEQQGRIAEAENIWCDLAKAHPSSSKNSAEAYAHLGLLEARQEHYQEAVPFYRKALALSPAMPGVRLNLGLALFKAGELKEASKEFSLLLKGQAPASPEAQRLTILIGMAHYGLGNYAAAVPYLKSATAHDPQNLALHLTLAHSCLWSKQYPCVLDVYKKILALNAESAEGDMLAGEALDAMKDGGGATQQFRAAVQANPKEPNVHFGLGYLLWAQRQYPEAAQEFQAELANDPNHPQALAYLADADMQMSRPEAALPLFERAIRIDPGLELAHLDLGILYADAGRQEDSLRELKAAAELAPGDVNVHWRLGRLYRAMGKKDEAKAEFDKASSLHKATDDALVNKMNPQAKPGQTAPSQPIAK